MMLDPGRYHDQFVFQMRYAAGRILNVGCDSDGALFRFRPGAVNVDLHLVSRITGSRNPAHVLADARRLPFKASFDTVVLGEILEHMQDKDVMQCLEEAKAAMRGRTSRVVITVPHDTREREQQGYGQLRYFADGIPVHHPRCVSREELLGWVKAAEMAPVVMAEISYVWGEKGTGLVAKVMN